MLRQIGRHFCRLNTVRCFRQLVLAQQVPRTWAPTAVRGISLNNVSMETDNSSRAMEDEQAVDKEEMNAEQSSPLSPPAAAVPDRYAYFQRGFTSEIYKLEIHNLPEFVGFRQVKKRLKNMQLDPVKVKIGPKNSWCFITFRSEEEKMTAMKTITGHVWKRKTLRATSARPAVDPLAKRKRHASSDDEESSKRPHQEKSDSPPRDITERLAEAVTPLLDKPYSEQLDAKLVTMRSYLARAAIQIKKTRPGQWFEDHINSNDGLLCAVEPVRPSPVLEHYRNKCEFQISLDHSGEPIIGFRLGLYKDGDLTVVSPDSCVHVPQPMKDIVKIFTGYVKQSDKAIFDQHTCRGCWKQLNMRCYTTGETMVTVVLHPDQLTQEEIESEMEQIRTFFETGDGEQCKPTSLYLQLTGRTRGEATDYRHILGEKHIHEELLGLKFRVSPDAFFQVNTAAAGVLYSTIAELCSSTDSTDSEPLVYDICCGTGTIGLCLTKCLPVSRIVGVEMSKQAVEDACENARLNGVTKTEFLCGKAEDIIPGMMTGERSAEVIAIADPPRSGLHLKVVRSIRQCKRINKLVYASCSPEGALSNFIEPSSNRLKGLPFRPVRAIPVDMFPHTSHCELLVLFERVPESAVQQTLKRSASPPSDTKQPSSPTSKQFSSDAEAVDQNVVVQSPSSNSPITESILHCT